MNVLSAIRLLICLFVLALLLCTYIHQQHEIICLKIEIPTLIKEVQTLNEANAALHYEIECFESPDHLIELSRQTAFSHLKHPLAKEVMTLPEGIALSPLPDEKKSVESAHSVRLACSPLTGGN